MPYIKINETEDVSYAQFDITDNTVLIPMLYARKYEGSVYKEDIPGSLPFVDAAKFKSDMSTGAGPTGNSQRYVIFSDGMCDKSYVMAYELLLKGLKVIIKPIEYNNIDAEAASTKDKYIEILEDAISDGAFEEFKNRNNYNIKFITTGGYPNFGKIIKKKIYKTKVDSVKIYQSADDKSTVLETIESKGTEVTYMRSSGEFYQISYKKSETETVTGYVKKVEIEVEESATELQNSRMYELITEIAESRRDAISLIELKEDLSSTKDIISEIKSIGSVGDTYKYAAGFTPWANFNVSAVKSSNGYTMPACFAYLMAYANSVQSNANWFAAAGVIRGVVPNMIKPLVNIGESVMHTLQNDGEGESLNACFNPIYNAGTYGYKIWGNRVLRQSDVTTNYRDFLNVRMLLCDIHKQIYHAAMRTTFEPNDDIVWINFKTLANSLLDKMKSGRGISWYNWVKKKSTNKAVITAVLSLKPIEAVESFDITVRLTDETVDTTEE